MTSAKQTTQTSFREFRWWLLLVIAYIALLLILPANSLTTQNYDLSDTEYKVLRLAVTLPSLAVWLVAFWGVSKLRQYCEKISESTEGESFCTLLRGCTWLAWSLPIPVFSSLILGTLAASHEGLRPLAVIVTNYLSLILPLIAFIIISTAARGIVGRSRVNLTHAGARFLMLFFLIAGVLYCYLTFSHLDMTSLSSSQNVYYLPVWIIVTTLMVPYLYAWFTGVIAAYEIALFSLNAKGVLYRRALGYLVTGIILIIASFIAVQYLSGVQPSTYQFSLNLKLILAIIFRVIGGVGFLFLALGAIKLKRIEDV